MTRKSGRAILGALLLVGLASVVPARATVPAPADGYGFSPGAATDYLPLADVERELTAVSATGATWLRILIDWNRIEPSKGHYDWTRIDALVAAARRHGLKILGVIAYTAEWARPPGSFFTAFPENPQEFGTFAAATAYRYRDDIAHWQVWNEPNLPQFAGFATVDGARYTELLKAAYPQIKSVLPGSTVVTAALSRQLGEGSPPVFFEQMYAAGAQGMFDAAAAHPYVFPGGLAADPENAWSDVSRLHDVLVAHGDGHMKIWLTELGAPTSDPMSSVDGVSQSEQASQIRAVLAAAAATPYCGPAFIYSIRDLDTEDRADRESNFGALLTTDWKPKVAAAELAR